MKRSRQLLAILAASVMTFGIGVTALAAEVDPAGTAEAVDSPVTAEEAVDAGEAETTDGEAAETTEPAEPAVVYDDLAVTDKIYYSNGGRDYGVYPVVEGLSSLTEEIESLLWDALTYTEKNYGDSSEGNLFKSSYTVTNDNRYAKIELNVRYQASTNAYGYNDEGHVYYIDKESMTLITEDEYNAGIEAQTAGTSEETAEEVPAEPTEVIMVSLTDFVGDLGYSAVLFEDINTVRLYKEDNSGVAKSVVIGKNQYVVNGKLVELEAAPVIQDGMVFVPLSYFELVLGANVSVDAEGNLIIN